MTDKQINWKKIQESGDYRSFLKNYLDEHSLSLSDFARATGFGRAFPGAVILGKRRLTAKSYAVFDTAMKLPLSGRKLFKNLVALEEPTIFPKINVENIPKIVQELRCKTWVKVQKNSDAVSSLPNAFTVLAALGTPAHGANPQKIAELTGLTPAEVMTALNSLELAKLISSQNGEYKTNDAFIVLHTNENPETVKQQILDLAKRVSLSNEDTFFLGASICVDLHRLPELKINLRKKIHQFLEEAHDGNGNKVVQLFTALC
jgi:hypothetical protein